MKKNIDWQTLAFIILAIVVIGGAIGMAGMEQPNIDRKQAFCENQGGYWTYTGSAWDGYCRIGSEIYHIGEDSGGLYLRIYNGN